MNDDIYHQYVVFMDAPQKPYLKALKQGFRHCAYVVKHKDDWVIYDPLSNYTDLMISSDPTLITRFETAGFVCVPIKSRNRKLSRFVLPEFLTCVTQIKRILGIQNILIQTPHQLYIFLTKDKS
jgi:hypothetical protein